MGCPCCGPMPFLTEVLLKIFQATGQNWERAGNVRYAVICRGEKDGTAEERCQTVAREWSAAMQASRMAQCGTLWLPAMWISK